MTKALGNFEKGPFFGSTLGLILAHWHFSWCKVTPNPMFWLKPASPLHSAVKGTPFPPKCGSHWPLKNLWSYLLPENLLRKISTFRPVNAWINGRPCLLLRFSPDTAPLSTTWYPTKRISWFKKTNWKGMALSTYSLHGRCQWRSLLGRIEAS